MATEEKEIDIDESSLFKNNPGLLETLLLDRSTKKNLIWGTSNYKSRGVGFFETDYILPDLITGKHHGVIKPRSEKAVLEQKKRSKDMAEVFTPAWVCNKQNNLVDDAWFGSKNSFNNENEDLTWNETLSVAFPTNRTWQDYVNDTRLEVACGEAPYLVSRYDSVTGAKIAIKHRIGLLDRKLRVVDENAKSKEEWIEFAMIAVKNIYGFDFQGDNVLLARENVFYSFIEYYKEHFGETPDESLLQELATVVSWNIWQMDGLKFVVPDSCHKEICVQMSLFGDEEEPDKCRGCLNGHVIEHNGIRCVIMDWEKNKKVKILDFFNGGQLW